MSAPAAASPGGGGRSELYGFLRIFAWLSIVGGGLLLFALIDAGLGLLGAAIMVQALLGALIIFAVARIGDGVDELLAAKRESEV